VLGLIYAFLPTLYTGIRSFSLLVDGVEREYYQCSYDNGMTQTGKRTFMAVHTALTCLVPFAILTSAYVAIVRKLKRSSTNGACNQKYYQWSTNGNANANGCGGGASPDSSSANSGKMVNGFK